jgi:hypothetical protein
MIWGSRDEELLLLGKCELKVKSAELKDFLLSNQHKCELKDFPLSTQHFLLL